MIRSGAAEIKRLSVKPAARGLGLGRKLMDCILTFAGTLGASTVLLETGVNDTAAQELYRSLGFRVIDGYPEGGERP